jgi:BirA family biotin operon repressor/biotin-[acetyl-CoA-carboxylase] ligase
MPYQPLIFDYQEIDSTNDEALRLVDQNTPPFFVAAARQTSGRGRMGRTWHSPEGNIYFTAVFKAVIPLSELPHFTLFCALKLCDAVARHTGAKTWLKWPNDLWIGSKKCGGFLAESPVSPNLGRLLLLGVGLNVNTVDFPEELKKTATSLKLETGKDWPLQEIQKLVCRQILDAYGAFSSRQYEAELMALWDKHDRLTGKEIKFEENGAVHSGRVLGLAANGSLNVNVGGKMRPLRSGEVTISKFLRGRGKRITA